MSTKIKIIWLICSMMLIMLHIDTYAQEDQIIGGYLLDGKDSFEELDAAVLNDSKRKDKHLDGKGMRFPGGVMMMIPESIELEPGEYYISFALTEISETLKDKWTDSKTWDEKERYASQLEDSIFFPVYVKSSYSRENSDSPLTKWKYNIGIAIRGISI